MDWSSFIGGVVASLAGVGATLLSTKKMELMKAKTLSDSSERALYLELSDLTDDLGNTIDVYYTVFAQYRAYELSGNSELLINITMPQATNFEILKYLTYQCFSGLTREQRRGLKKLLAMSDSLNDLYPKVLDDLRFNRESANIREINVLMSLLCSTYHLTNELCNCEARFKFSAKHPQDKLKEVFASRSLSLEDFSIMEYVEKAT